MGEDGYPIFEARREEIERHNEEVRQNKEMLRTLSEAVLYLVKQELPFRGHDWLQIMSVHSIRSLFDSFSSCCLKEFSKRSFLSVLAKELLQRNHTGNHACYTKYFRRGSNIKNNGGIIGLLSSANWCGINLWHNKNELSTLAKELCSA